jgi:hypothetical protein
MNTCILFLASMLLSSCTAAIEKNYTASTPANAVVKTFLGIPLSDSVDFIRWKLKLSDNRFTLWCNYGIGKPNTNGFYNGGKTVELAGGLTKQKNIFHLQSSNKTLKITELNADLLHVLNADNSLMTGNGGWSYTLNNIKPVMAEEINLNPGQIPLPDSMIFEGRSPCAVPGFGSTNCYKLKWYIVLYAGKSANRPATYKMLTSTWRQDGGKKGKWEIAKGKNNRIIYKLYDDKGLLFLQLLKPDENILLFIDAEGKPLVGDEDFSYTLSKTQ